MGKVKHVKLLTLLMLALITAAIPAVSSCITHAQAQVITVQFRGSNINVSINVPSNLSSGVAIVALLKVINGSEEISRLYVVRVVGGDRVSVNMTNIPSGEYVLRVMIWNDMLLNLKYSGKPWFSIKFYECTIFVYP